MGMFDWTEKSAEVVNQGGVIAPDERLPWPQTAAMGVQHVIAMFGATVLASSPVKECLESRRCESGKDRSRSKNSRPST